MIQHLLVRGRLLENMPGSTVNGIIYDRNLKIMLNSGRVLSVFDDNYPYVPLSTGLVVDKWYKFLLSISIGTPTQYHQAVPPLLDSEQVGMIVDCQWLPPLNPEQYYHHFGPRLYHNAGGFFVVQHQHDDLHLLFGPDDIWPEAVEGAYITWHSARIELLAVAEIEDTEK